MQILDFNQLVIAAVFAVMKDMPLEMDSVRGLMLGMIRKTNFKFKHRYGEFVIAADGQAPYWRKELFPHYKSSRKTKRDNDTTDWKKIYEIAEQFKAELREHFPYRLIEIPHVEADDIIATLSIYRDQPVVIISTDRDYIQLHTCGVEQFDPINDRMIKHECPEAYLIEHVLKGDRGDGIPNVLSPDDCFVNNIRQTPMTQQRFDMVRKAYLAEEDDLDWGNIVRNERLIDLTKIPPEIMVSIQEEFKKQEGMRNRTKMRKYFAVHGFNQFAISLGEF